MTSERPHVSIDPAMRWGQPHIGGISVDAIGGLVWAEHAIAAAVDDYGLTRAQVLVACWYLGRHGPRRWRARWRTWVQIVEPALVAQDYDAVPDPPAREAN